LPWALAATLLVGSLGARADGNYPNRPIHIVVPYPAGGIVDIVARTGSSTDLSAQNCFRSPTSN
jgi:tripartite-type tricarboxylate transporter receptor subunit TctC